MFYIYNVIFKYFYGPSSLTFTLISSKCNKKEIINEVISVAIRFYGFEDEQCTLTIALFLNGSENKIHRFVLMFSFITNKIVFTSC